MSEVDTSTAAGLALACLKNMGHDIGCAACMGVAFAANPSQAAHSCEGNGGFWGRAAARLQQKVNEQAAEVATLRAQLAEAQARARAWTDSAAEFARNQKYYRSLVERIARSLPGDDVYVADDGSRHDEPLVAKVPDVVVRVLAEAQSALRAIDEIALVLESRAALLTTPAEPKK